MVECFFNTKITIVYYDGEGKYQALLSLLVDCGIQHLTLPPHTPQLVGTMERRHRHIVETGLTLLHQASIPFSYWSVAFSTVVYLINHLPNLVL